MKTHSHITLTLLVAGALVVSSALLIASAQANDTPPSTQIPAADSARLSWKPPTTHVDGSGGLHLVRFHIYSRSPEKPWKRIATVAAMQTTYTVRDLPPGRHDFAVTAVCSKHGESALSNIESKMISSRDVERRRG